MSDHNPNKRGDWKTPEVMALVMCAALALWGVASGASSVRARAMDSARANTRQKVRETADAKAETALTTFAADLGKTRFRVPLDLALGHVAEKMEQNATAFRELIVSRAPDPLVDKGRGLFQAKICFTCHQTNPAVPALAGLALKAPKFIGDFWGKEREVELNSDPASAAFMPSGKFENAVMDEAYVIESIEKPNLKVVKGAVAGMAPLPTTLEERKALAAYIKNLSNKP